MVGFLAIDQQVCMCVWFKAPQYQTIPLDHWCCPFQERLSNLVLKRMKIWSFQIAKKITKLDGSWASETKVPLFCVLSFSPKPQPTIPKFSTYKICQVFSISPTLPITWYRYELRFCQKRLDMNKLKPTQFSFIWYLTWT